MIAKVKHIICVIITLGFLACSFFVFPHSLGRLVESGRDFGLSIAFFFCKLFGNENAVSPTVTSYPQIPFFPFLGDYRSPISSLPETWNGFVESWETYWQLWIDGNNFLSYLSFVWRLFFILLFVAMILLPIVLLVRFLFRRYLHNVNNYYGKESKPLRKYKQLAKSLTPIKLWICDFIQFVQNHKSYKIIWLCIWLYNFNVFTIGIEFFAYYLYFISTFDFVGIYIQLYKLSFDLWSFFSILPLWAWFIVGVLVLNWLCKKIAFLRLQHNERKNRGFINSLGVSTVVYGAMGVGKTTQITDMALSAEIEFRDMAFEIILETDMHFPYFPWINFENELKKAIVYHEVWDLPSVRRWVLKKEYRWNKNKCREKIYGYDYERYGITYDDNLKLTNIWQSLEDYACAYFIYTVQSSLLISNYSVRTDNLFADLGNFPLWNTDFFNRDSRLVDSYSRHAHILDFDMLRLGKQMLADNPNRYAFGFGVYIISEIDKERKNTPELKEVKANSDECNQKNDLFNVLLKMSRHACVVSNRVFVKIFADLQRPSSLGADALELGDIINITDKGDMSLLLPFFTPFRLFDILFGWLKKRWDNFYTQYRYARADNTLFLYFTKSLVAKLCGWHEKYHNLYSSQTLTLALENGARDGEVKQFKYYRMPKKIYSKRYSTNCLSGIFETRAACNSVGLDDLREYADIMASSDELGMQNSHFQKEINVLNVQK